MFTTNKHDRIKFFQQTILPRLTNLTPELHLLNVWMASLWQCIEHVFGDHRARFKLFAVPHYLHLFNQGVKVRRVNVVSFFILNCFYCFDGTRSHFFGHVPPMLEDYLPLDEVLEPLPAVNLGTVWDYGGTPPESWFSIWIWHGFMVILLLRVHVILYAWYYLNNYSKAFSVVPTPPPAAELSKALPKFVNPFAAFVTRIEEPAGILVLSSSVIPWRITV